MSNDKVDELELNNDVIHKWKYLRKKKGKYIQKRKLIVTPCEIKPVFEK